MLAGAMPSRLPAGTGGGSGVNAQAIAPSQERVLAECERQWGTTLEGWRREDECAEAHGLTCDRDGMITSLRVALQHGGSLGSIPVTIGNLTQLTYLSLTSNGLTGAIPPVLGSLTLLDTLDLSHNNLSGRIPASLQHLDRLRTL
ncbi:hypothetical protein CLOP_g25727 [Closterium sp. NIES-67]|nr:hypothetical protein CLOP_g25727 [Closterium sp. NIES-67]